MPSADPSPNRLRIVSGNQWRFAITSLNPWRGSSLRMCSMIGRFTTGTMGLGTS